LVAVARYKKGEQGWRRGLNEPIAVPPPEILKVFYPDVVETERESYYLTVERASKMRQLAEERGLSTYRDVAFFLAERCVPGFKVAGEDAKRRVSIRGGNCKPITKLKR
jgi:hypothetical protein